MEVGVWAIERKKYLIQQVEQVDVRECVSVSLLQRRHRSRSFVTARVIVCVCVEGWVL